MRRDAPIPGEVQLEGVRVLSFSKISSVPVRKGKGKDKSKSKGKDKASGHGKDKATGQGKATGKGNARQDAIVMYLGQEKQCIAVSAFGDDVQKLPQSLRGCLVDVQGLRHRAGQAGTLYWSEAAIIGGWGERVRASTPP
jgi:hypothetical protein